MRLLIVTQYFWPETFRVNEIVSELTARGHEVTVLTGRPNYPEGTLHQDYVRDPKRFSQYAGADVLRVPLRPRGRGNLRLLMNYWSFVFWGCVTGPWLLRGRSFDAIFMFETSPITSALPAILLKWLKKARLSMWVLDLWPDTLSAVGIVKSPRLLNVVGKLCAFIYRHCDLILVQSRAFFAPIERWSKSTAKTRYFPAWSEAAFDNTESHVPAPELAPHRDFFNIVFAGNIGEPQDFPAILDAAEHTKHRPDIHWLIVGDGRMAEFVHSEIISRNLSSTVFMLGRHPIERMPSFFAAAGALLVSLRAAPIFAMTIPGKVQSYLASGIPILAMLDGEGARVIQEAGAGLTCASGDSRMLALQAITLADMELSVRQRMGAAGQSYGRNHFNRGHLIEQLEKWLLGKS